MNKLEQTLDEIGQKIDECHDGLEALGATVERLKKEYQEYK